MSIALNGSGWYSFASAFGVTEAQTFMAWFFPTTLPSSGNFTNALGSQQHMVIDLHNSAGTTHWSVGTGVGDLDSTTVVSANTWYHVAFTVASGASPTKTIYVNGTQENSGSDSDTCGNAFVIGTWDLTSAGAYIGRIAATKWYKGVVLTAAEIQQEMRQFLPVRTASLSGFYPMVAGLSDDEIDFSGNAKTLTVGGSGQALADGPPIPWRRGRYGLVVPAAPAVTSRRIIPAYQIPRRFEQSFLE